MRFFAATVASLALLVPVFGAPPPMKTVKKFPGKTVAGSYIVKLKDGVTKSDVVGQFGSAVTHDWDSSLLNGFAGKFDEDALNTLRASQDVDYIEEDGIMSIFTTQTNAPWGISRICQTKELTSYTLDIDLTFTYTYDSPAGAGSDIYIVDTGVYTSNTQFGGRARWGATFGGYPNADGNGHGTHCAGIAAGSQFGVAKAADIIAVKVLDDEGDGAVADIVSGLSWVITQVQASGRPSIASLSFGGGAADALDDAVTSLITAGIHVAVAAGNSAEDASLTSPARVAAANTIGATTITDTMAYFSNFGSVVDLFAPGDDITSAWIGSTTATNILSGTSMSTPHVAGLIAYLISVNGNSSPATMSTTLQTLSVKNALSGIPNGTANYLAYNGD